MGATVLTDAFPATSDLRRSTLTGAPRIAPGCIAGRSTLGVLALSCVLGLLLPRRRIMAVGSSLTWPVGSTLEGDPPSHVHRRGSDRLGLATLVDRILYELSLIHISEPTRPY